MMSDYNFENTYVFKSAWNNERIKEATFSHIIKSSISNFQSNPKQ